MKIKSYLLLVLFVVVTGSFKSNAQLPAGLKLYLPFTNNANDASGLNHNGTAINATLTADRFGNPNSAYDFNGSNAHVQIADHADLRPTSLTLSAWMYYPSVPTATQSVIGKGFCSGPSDSYTFFFYVGTFYAGIGHSPNQSDYYFFTSCCRAMASCGNDL